MAANKGVTIISHNVIYKLMEQLQVLVIHKLLNIIDNIMHYFIGAFFSIRIGCKTNSPQ